MFIISLLNGPPLLCSWCHSTSPCSSSLPFTPCPSFLHGRAAPQKLPQCLCVCSTHTSCPARVHCSGLSHSCGCCFCFLPLLFSVMKNFGLLWARGMPGAGNAGRRVREESESSTAGSPYFPSATALLWVHTWRQLEPLCGHWRCLHTQGRVSPWVWAHLAVIILPVYPPWRDVFAVLLPCPHLCFSAALSGVFLAWHYQVQDHLWKWRGAVLDIFGPAVG